MKRCCHVARTAFSYRVVRRLSWQVQSSLIVERLPQCQPPRDPFLAEYLQLKDTLRTEGSVYNDFEMDLNKRKDDHIVNQKVLFPKQHKLDLQEYLTKADINRLVDPVRNDKYIPMPPVDRSKDKQSVLDIKPQNSVYLLVKTGDTWTFPHKLVETENSLDEAGKCAVFKNPHTEDLSVEMQSSLPISCHVNKYSKRAQKSTNFTGVKTFFLKSYYKSGNLKGEEFMWCPKEELKHYLSEEIYKCIEPCLK